jgi:hypothetical protein
MAYKSSEQMVDQSEIETENLPRSIRNLSSQEIDDFLAKGGRLVFFEFCISFIFITLRHTTTIKAIRSGQWAWVRGLPYSLISLLLGWWGLPWGPIYSFLTIVTNVQGGCDVSSQVRELWLKKTVKFESEST